MVTIEETRIYKYLSDVAGWVTSRDVAVGACVAPRTARHHLKRLTDVGDIERSNVFPYRYKMSNPSVAYRNWMNMAMESFSTDTAV